MNIILVGYGKMGKMIETKAIERGHRVIFRVDAQAAIGDLTAITVEVAQKADLIIEFALPDQMDANIEVYAKSKTPVIIGTTGWGDKMDKYKKIINENQASLLYGSNYSIGAHIMFRLVESAAQLINPVDDYDIMVNEFHHKFKKDSPSGTALTIAEKIIDNCQRKSKIQTKQLNRSINPNELHVAAIRGGFIPGKHSVVMDGEADTIEITHNARSRGGFALGAVMAGEWLTQKPSGFYNVEAFISDLLDNVNQ